MSKIIWSRKLSPDLSTAPSTLNDDSYQRSVENVRPYPVASEQIAIPDPKAFRSMSRAAVFLSHICMDAKDALAPFLAKSPFSVGVYCAVENGPIDAPSTVKILAQPDESKFAESYKKFRSPKMYLKQLPNLVPAQMGISMKLQGPTNVYTHSMSASIHALEQAEWDLKTGAVEAALVCTAHAFDDFLVLFRERASDQRCLTEGAAALLLVNNGEFTKWNELVKNKDGSPLDPKNFFGIADPMIQIVTMGDTNAN